MSRDDIRPVLGRIAHLDSIEPLFPRNGTITTVGFQEVMAAICQRHSTLAAVKGDRPSQTLVTQVPQVRLARVDRLVTRVAEIALSDYSKCPNGRQRSAVLAVQLVPMITIDDDLAFESAR